MIKSKHPGLANVMPSTAKTAHDDLQLPGGGLLGSLDNGQLAAHLVGLGIPGASHENGRAANAKAYADFLDDIRTRAAHRAVTDWISRRPF